VAGRAVSDKPYELAYETSVRAIADQASVLESLRSRAGTLFAATSLVTSFLGGGVLIEIALWIAILAEGTP
jgi:hypothetical protein